MNRKTFKIGDFIRCTAAYCSSGLLTLGEEYVVVEVGHVTTYSSSFQRVKVRPTTRSGCITPIDVWFSSSRFELNEQHISLMTDASLAEKYRTLRKESEEIGRELVRRGYKLYVNDKPSGMNPETVRFTFKKVSESIL